MQRAVTYSNALILSCASCIIDFAEMICCVGNDCSMRNALMSVMSVRIWDTVASLPDCLINKNCISMWIFSLDLVAICTLVLNPATSDLRE